VYVGFSDEARKSAALARKIKSRLGTAAYNEFKRTGVVPAGLEGAAPSQAKTIKQTVATVPSAPGKLPAGPKRTAEDLAKAELAAKLGNLAEPRIFTAFASRRLSAKEMTPIAREQARNDMPDSALINHYKSSGIFEHRGVGADGLKKIRDDFHTGKKVPLWAIPPGTDVALYRSSDATSPDLIGRVIGTVHRKPEGLSINVPYVRFADQQGRVYEYPALLSGSKHAPHATHASFAAIDPIQRGSDTGVPQLGWGFPNFFTGPAAGPGSAPEDVGKLADNIVRALNWATSVEDRKRRKEIAAGQANSMHNVAMNNLEHRMETEGYKPDAADVEWLINTIAKVSDSSLQEKARANELARSIEKGLSKKQKEVLDRIMAPR
jgi:hypothetical protein